MKYLLDTCVISDFVKGENGTLEKIKSMQPAILATSTITLMEIHYGLKKNPAKARGLLHIIKELLHSIHILPFNSGSAKIAGDMRAQLKATGSPIGSYNLLIASIALEHNLTLVTSDISEFNKVEGLIIDNWCKRSSKHKTKATGE